MTADPPSLEHFRPALDLWAKCQMPVWLRDKLDPTDLVQQTLLEGHAARDKLAGRSDLEVLGYLRRALANNLTDAVRKFAPARGEVSPDDPAGASARLADWLAADHTSPSERAARNEQFERLAGALARLPDAQRVAVELRYLQLLKLAEIARLMSRTEGAVSQLLHRAVTDLRGALADAP